MRKRILSILLCLVMVVGLFPTMASADDSGATTGSGTKSDPYCVSTYAEMKRLLQTRASYYIKVVGMDNDATNDGVPVRVLVAGKDFVSTEPAIDIPSGANHHLEIATKIWFITKEQDGDKNIFGRLIDVERGSSLEITGTGSLRVEVNTLVATNAIICNWGGELTIDGSVVLNGIQNFTSNVATRPIFINGGVTNIKGGYIYGHNNMTAINDGVTSAIHFGETLAEGTALNISGGTIRQYNNEINQENENSCALYVKNDTAAIHLTGGTFEGGMKMKTGKPLSDLLTAGYQFNDMSTNTVFDGSVSKCHDSPSVDEQQLQQAILRAINSIMSEKPALVRQVTENLQVVIHPNRSGELTIAEIDHQLESLAQEFDAAFITVASGNSTDYMDRFKAILSQQAELKAKRVELERQQAEDAELTSHMGEAAGIMEQAGTVITEWNERNIRDLVASVRILSKEEILVRLKSGIEVKERLV